MSQKPGRNPERRGVSERAVAVSSELPARELRWSASSVSTFEQCPLKFWWGKVAGWQEGPSVATAAGSAVHSALEHLLAHDPAARTPDVASAALDAALAEAEPEMTAAALPVGDVVVKAQSALDVYWTVEDPVTVDVIPGGIERQVGPVLADVPFIGFADRIATSPTGARVTDYKTGVAKPRYFGSYYRQQYLYAAALEADDIEVTEIELLFLGDGRRVRRPVYPRAVARALGDLTSAAESAEQMAQTGEWTARQSALCGWCAFERVCPLRTSKAPVPGSAASDERLEQVPGMVRRTPAASAPADGLALPVSLLDAPELLL